MKLNPTITSDAFDRKLSQSTCFGGSLVFLVCCVFALQRYCETPAQLLIGLLTAVTATVSLIILGIITGPPAKAAS